MVGGVHDDYLPSDRLPRRELDVAFLGRRLAAHRRWLVGPALVCFIVSAIAVNVIPPRYTAETQLLLENQESYFTRSDKADLQQAQLPDDQAVQSQVQLVSSRDIAREAIKRLGLQGNPEFDPLADGVGPLTRMLVLLGLERDPMRVSPEERILTTYFEKLTVYPVTKSRVLTVDFESKDPDLSARAANTIADLYIDVQSGAKRDAARAAAESLGALIASLRVKSAEAEAAAQVFRNQSGLLLGTNNVTITSQQLGDMSTQLAQARSAEADAQAKAKLIRDMIKTGRVSEVSDVAASDLTRRLAEQRANVQADFALQSRTLLPGHPRMQELTAQLSDIDRQMRAAADKAARSLENDAHIARSKLDNLTAAMNTQKEAIGATGSDQVKLSELDLNAKLLKDQLEFNTAKYQEAVARESAESTPADARIISRAVAPQLPSFPKKLPIIAIFTIAGAVLSLGVLIARELLSGRAFMAAEPVAELPMPVQSEHVVDEEEGVWQPTPDPVFKPKSAPVPELDVSPVDQVPSEPEPVFAQREEPQLNAIALMTEELLIRKQSDQALRIVVADTNQLGGSASLTARLGRLLSRSHRAIAVDFSLFDAGDDTAPSLKDVVGYSEQNLLGVTDLLAGEASFAEVIHRDVRSRLHFIPKGLPDTIGVGLDVDQDGIANVLDALAETYDFVFVSAASPNSEDVLSVLTDHSDMVILNEGKDSTREDFNRIRARFGSAELGGPELLVFRHEGETSRTLVRGVAA